MFFHKKKLVFCLFINYFRSNVSCQSQTDPQTHRSGGYKRKRVRDQKALAPIPSTLPKQAPYIIPPSQIKPIHLQWDYMNFNKKCETPCSLGASSALFCNPSPNILVSRFFSFWNPIPDVKCEKWQEVWKKFPELKVKRAPGWMWKAVYLQSCVKSKIDECRGRM